MEGIIQPQYPFEVKRYVQYLELPNDADAIREYRRLHSKEGHWPEIVKGIREVGILEMDLYIVGNHLVMIVVAPADFDWDKAMAGRTRSASSRAASPAPRATRNGR